MSGWADIMVTVVYLPLVLPLLLPSVTIDAGQIALSLFGLMLVPLAIGLAARWRWEEAAGEIKGPLAQVSNVSLVLLLVLTLGLNIENVIALFGSGALLAVLILTVVRPSLATCSAVRAVTRAVCWRWGRPCRIWPPRSWSRIAASPTSRT